MAIYFLRVQTVRRAAGRSIVAAAAYRAGERLLDERSGRTFDYTRRQGVVASGLVGWEGSRQALWNAAEAAEKRKDSVLGREVLVALPHGLPRASQQALLARLAGWLRQEHRVAVDWCMHAPDPEGDGRNWHGHLLLTSRRVDGGNMGAKTLELDRLPASRQSVEVIRQVWAGMVNQALARHGLASRVDSRSHVRRAANCRSNPKLPMLTLGYAAARAARRGNATWRTIENTRRRAANDLGRAISVVMDAATETPPQERQRER